MKYTVKKGLAGYVVRYACPGCQSDLRAPIKDAGNNEICTDCGTKYVVPGSAEKQTVMDAVAAKKQQIAEQKEQAKASKELMQRLAAEEKERQAKSQGRRLKTFKCSWYKNNNVPNCPRRPSPPHLKLYRRCTQPRKLHRQARGGAPTAKALEASIAHQKFPAAAGPLPS